MSAYNAGDVVRVRSSQEILATLDTDGRLEGLPFMPEMLQYCGQVFTVSRSAHKTCDTVTKTGGRRLNDTVHLADLRCSGAAHGGCEALCLVFWKTAWLMPALEGEAAMPDEPPPAMADQLATSETLPGWSCSLSVPGYAAPAVHEAVALVGG